MKNRKRIVSLFLCVLMLASLSMPALAQSTPPSDEKYPQFDSMFTIGDSNAMGYGLPGYKGNPSARHSPEFKNSDMYTIRTYLKGIEGSFPQVVEKGLSDAGVEITHEDCDVMAYPGMRGKDMLYFLGGDVDMSEDAFFQGYVHGGWDNAILRDIRPEMSDEEYAAAFDSFVSDPYVPYFDTLLKQKGENGNNLTLVYAGASDVFFSCFDQVDLSGDLVTAALQMPKLMWDHYLEFIKDFPQLMNRIRELDPNGTIAVVGMFNPVKDLKISEDIWVPVFDALSAVTAVMNSNLKYWASQYDNCVFVDISNVETATLEEGLTVSKMFQDDPELIYHATVDGYQYIGRQILKALEVEKTATTDIIVDLGSVKSVKSVSVGDYKVPEFSFDPETHTLTVPYGYTTAKLLTVTEVRENGSVYVATYQLSYNGNGYDAYRLFASRDINETFANIIKSFMSVFQSIFDAIFGVFR